MNDHPTDSLAEFMFFCSKETAVNRFNSPKRASEWISLFETAHNSWLAYGPNPPLGSVRTLRAGFGGGGDDLRTLEGNYDESNKYFRLTGPKVQLGGPYVSAKKTWWLDFKVVEKTND